MALEATQFPGILPNGFVRIDSEFIRALDAQSRGDVGLEGVPAPQSSEQVPNPMKNVPFQLSCSDIQESWGGCYGHLKGSTIRLVHAPTGIEVTGKVPQIHRTNRQLRTAEAELRPQLLSQLTDAVAKHMRISGR